MEPVLKRIHEKKKKFDTCGPLPPEVLLKLEIWRHIEFVYSSNALAGSSLSFDETAIILGEGETIAGKSLQEYLNEPIQTKKRMKHK